MHKHKLNSQVYSTSETEQNLLACELHDSIGQALAILRTDLFLLERSLHTNREDISNRIHAMNVLLDHTIHAVRKISSELKPTPLKFASLEEAIQDYLNDFLNETGIQGNLEIKMNGTELERCHTHAIFKIFQEALDNVKYHSLATRVRVSLSINADDLSLVVIDNGLGIRSEDLDDGYSPGLVEMKACADSLGAELEIDGVPNKGTAVKMCFPIHSY